MTSYSKRSGNTRGVPSGVGFLRQVCAVLRHGLESRATQAEEVSEEIRRSPYPVILCGDFNEVPLSYAYRILTQGLRDDFQEALAQISLSKEESLVRCEQFGHRTSCWRSNGRIQISKAAAPHLTCTHDEKALSQASIYIVTVPTPVDEAHRPDLRPLISASEIVGRHLKKGDIVVFESTVYPGCTEEVCLPGLEKASGLKAPGDFTLGYSPERINPGDTEHTLETMVKIISAQTPEALEVLAQVYGAVNGGLLHRAPNIRTAEAAKVIENTQRDLNIALMNELSMLFHRLDIRTQDVLAAARTKWNFLPFQPGLVGGHCI